MSGSNPINPLPSDSAADVLAEYDRLPNVLSFNAGDPTGAGGSASDATVIASVGAHALPVVTGVYVRDTRDTIGHVAVDEAAIAEQAAAVAEDIPLHVIKVGFVGSAEAVSAIAAFASDYATVPVIAYMPDLSWWTEQEIDHYLDAFRELLLPQTTVLVGNNATLRHWLLPESTTDRRARATDLARAALNLAPVAGLDAHLLCKTPFQAPQGCGVGVLDGVVHKFVKQHQGVLKANLRQIGCG